MINKIKIDPCCHEFFTELKGGVAGHIAVEFRFIRRDGIHDGDVADMVPLAHEIREPFKIFQERSHVFPVRHPEMITGWRPFPVGAIGGVVQAVQIEQRAAVEEILASHMHQTFG